MQLHQQSFLRQSTDTVINTTIEPEFTTTMPVAGRHSLSGLCFVSIWTKRASIAAFMLGLYSMGLTVSFRLLRTDHYSAFPGETDEDIVLRKCLDSSGLVTPQDNRQVEESSSSMPQFRLLCTSITKRISWGSYRLRCIDLKRWAGKCARNVEITTGIPVEDLEKKWTVDLKASDQIDFSSLTTSTKFFNYLSRIQHNSSIDLSGQDMYNATIFVKALSRNRFPQYGNLFVDMVDEYTWKDEKIPKDMHLILQTAWQGPLRYPTHKASVVEHWYNSYPADMARTDPLPDYIPPVQARPGGNGDDVLQIATIWNTRRSQDPTEGGCPPLTVAGVRYDCLDRDFDISTWYLDFFKQGDAPCDMARTLAHPQLGQGMLYFNVFRNYDALVVPAKNHTMKLHYGNVQRAVSQMRSGVPVLMEIRGAVFEDFMDRYNYTCAYQRYPDEPSFLAARASSSPRKYWTFNEAVAQLKNVEVRRECQRQGLEIIRDYSPSAIGQKFLRVVGYDGEFEC